MQTSVSTSSTSFIFYGVNYLKDSTFIHKTSILLLKVTKGTRPSWGWQSILIGRDTISAKLKWSVGDESRISIHEDCWLPQGILGGPADKAEPRLVAELILPTHNKWN